MSECPYVIDGDCGYSHVPQREPGAVMCLCRQDAGEFDDDPQYQQATALADALAKIIVNGDE